MCVGGVWVVCVWVVCEWHVCGWCVGGVCLEDSCIHFDKLLSDLNSWNRGIWNWKHEIHGM